MDKTWIHADRTSDEYTNGVISFIDYAFDNASEGGKILCPCTVCVNQLWNNRSDTFGHLIWNGFNKSYMRWIYHGEELVSGGIVEETRDPSDDMEGMLHDAFGFPEEESEYVDADAEKFYRLVEEANVQLYPGCTKFSKLSFLVRLFHIKCMNGMSNVAFNMILQLLKEAFPEGEKLPKNYNETKKIMKDLGLEYNKIDACPNDCMLYWKENIEATSCRYCGASRWKMDREGREIVRGASKIPAKILRHFPLQPRLQRLFMCSKTAHLMRWHEDKCPKDGKSRHPVDGDAWKAFDSRHTTFASDARNVRLGLAADGFNPFRTMSTSHSTWPIVMIPYNLPPWMCMKNSYLMLSLLIPGPKSPKNLIDVYLQPLIDELKDLWVNGVKTYDASRKETFQLHAALLWTLNDFPAYAMLSGWSTKGALACPCCCYDTNSQYLYRSRKTCYQGHRRFLSSNHRWRHNRRSFDGKKELRSSPKLLSGSKVFKLLKNVKVVYRGNLIEMSDNGPWKKKSIFFELPYWKYNKLRHNLDVMHIEKNICDNLIGTLLNIPGKTKDHANARYDLKDLGIRDELHPVEVGPKKIFLPPACFTMSSNEKNVFCKVLQGVKVPDGYASNISRCVQLESNTLSGMKSHDCHFVLHYLLALAIRRTLPRNVVEPLIELSSFFRSLCSKVLVPQELEQMERNIGETLCKLERIFPPSFFDIMVHLSVHLAREAKLGGPVQYRWMYSIERYFMKLKSYVRNRCYPEGSIAEGYLAEECLTFCSRYLNDNVETAFNRPRRNYDSVRNESGDSSILPKGGCPIGKGKMFTLDEKTRIQAHRYVLFNCNAISSYIEEHRDILESQRRQHRSKRWNTAREHSEEFHEWFEARVMNDVDTSTEIKWLSRGPNHAAKKFKGYLINGFRFRTKDGEKNRKTQNSGVIVKASTPSFASSRDQNPVVGEVTYYGVVREIIELDYYGHVNVVLFKCDWFQTNIDQFGLPLVDFSRLIYENDPFVFASQVQQVFYVQDPIDTNWHVANITIPRDIYDMGEKVQSENDDSFWLNEPSMDLPHRIIDGGGDNVNLCRDDVSGTIIDTSLADDSTMGFEHGDDYEYDNDDEYFSND